MTRIALLSAAAVVAAGTLTAPAAEARGGGALAAGIIGGLAAGALIGAATKAHAAPSYGYGYPDHGYAPARPVYRAYDVGAPVYEPRRVVTYGRGPVGYGPARPWRDDCERPDGYGRW